MTDTGEILGPKPNTRIEELNGVVNKLLPVSVTKLLVTMSNTQNILFTLRKKASCTKVSQ